MTLLSELYAFYLEQAGLAPAGRIATTPGGRPAKLADAEMPLPDGMIFLAPHPGQGQLLLASIDPSVADEQDPTSVVPQLDPFSPANGFAEPPSSSAYTKEFGSSHDGLGKMLMRYPHVHRMFRRAEAA